VLDKGYKRLAKVETIGERVRRLRKERQLSVLVGKNPPSVCITDAVWLLGVMP